MQWLRSIGFMEWRESGCGLIRIQFVGLAKAEGTRLLLSLKIEAEIVAAIVGDRISLEAEGKHGVV